MIPWRDTSSVLTEVHRARYTAGWTPMGAINAGPYRGDAVVEIADERGRSYAGDCTMVREDVAALDNPRGDGCARDAAGCGCLGGTPRRGPGCRPEHRGLGAVHPRGVPVRAQGSGSVPGARITSRTTATEAFRYSRAQGVGGVTRSALAAMPLPFSVGITASVPKRCCGSFRNEA